MGMDVDKARRHQPASGIDLFGAFAGNAADFGDAAVLDRDIGFEQFAAKTVGDAAATDHEVWIIGHGASSLCWICCRIMGGPMGLSTAAGEVQGCIRGSLDRSPLGFRSVNSASATVRTMNTTEAPN